MSKVVQHGSREDPERMRLGDVEGVRVGRFGGRLNTTCVVYRVGGTVIDTGPPNQWRPVRAFLAERPVEQVVLTHHHEDHAGNGARIAAAGTRVLAPRQSLDLLANGFPLQPYRRVVWGRPRRFRAEPFGERVEFAGGTLEPVLLPGHATDMTCLLDRERGVLFAADLYISRRLRYLRRDEDLRLMLDSLRRALDLDFETLLCAHAGVVEDGKARLAEKASFLESLCERAADLAARGLRLGQIVRRLLGPEDLISLASLLHFSKRNLIRACLEVASAR